MDTDARRPSPNRLPSVAESEIPLTGGTLNPVVRVDDTVRRPAGSWTPTIHALLRHVRDQGFDLGPEPLGVDQLGREILTYIPGTTVGWSVPWPEVIRSDDLLAQVGRATARYHRAVASFRPPGTVPWQSGAAALGESEIVCHNDIAPYNVVLAGRRLVGIIDWDLAGPGTARSDLAFVAWQWVPLHGPYVARHLGWEAPPDRARRLRLLLDAYGLDDRAGFIDDVVDRIGSNRATMATRAAEGDRAYQSLVDQGHLAGMDEAVVFLGEEGARLGQAIA
jgi:Phosphotransferase enzyme family